MRYHILVPKETRAGEQRVGLTPQDVARLMNEGANVFIESTAGEGADFTDQDYQSVGASIRHLSTNNPHAYQQLFQDINLILRVKRPERAREILENTTIAPGTIMVGALDPLERNSAHIQEYHRAGIIAYSIDQLALSPEDPMNILSAMSKIAGRLAVKDAIQKFQSLHHQKHIKKLIIIGFGAIGRSALAEAVTLKLPVTIILTNLEVAKTLQAQGINVRTLDAGANLAQQQTSIRKELLDADIVITSARKHNQPAPMLIPLETLQVMQAGSVIVDMALSEGGNVEGSEHDLTRFLGNNVMVTNTSGYPKMVPREASEQWSRANLHFTLLLATENPLPLMPL